MDYDTLKHRFGWFKEEADRLDEISARLDCERRHVEGIHLHMTNAYFSSLQTEYNGLNEALTGGKRSLEEGSTLTDNYAEAIRRTGRTYLKQEAENEEDATRITKLMDNENF